MRVKLRYMGYGAIAALVTVIIIAACVTPRYSSIQTNPVDVKYKQIKNKPDAKYNNIIRLKNEEGEFVCTGFVIDGRYAITAAHCIADENWKLSENKVKIFDLFDNNTEVVATPVGINTRQDQGLIQGDFTNFKPSDIDFNDFGFFSKGPFSTCGFPMGQKALHCSPFIPIENDGFLIFGKGYLTPGQSGGPVIDETTHRIVGINSQTAEGGVKVVPTLGILGAFNLE